MFLQLLDALVGLLFNNFKKGFKMENSVLERIKIFAINELKNTYGYCGLADGSNVAMINTDDKNGNDIKITIKLEPK